MDGRNLEGYSGLGAFKLTDCAVIFRPSDQQLKIENNMMKMTKRIALVAAAILVAALYSSCETTSPDKKSRHGAGQHGGTHGGGF